MKIKGIKKPLKLATRKGHPEITRNDAIHFGALAIFPTLEGTRGAYNLTHAPTGMKICDLYGKKKEIEKVVADFAATIGDKLDNTNIAAIQVLPEFKDWAIKTRSDFSAYSATKRYLG